jgi:hypothetical protein
LSPFGALRLHASMPIIIHAMIGVLKRALKQSTRQDAKDAKREREENDRFFFLLGVLGVLTVLNLALCPPGIQRFTQR